MELSPMGRGCRRFPVFVALIALLVIPWLSPRQVGGDPFRFAVTCDQRYYSGPGTYDSPSYYRGVCQIIAALGPGAFMVSPGDIDPTEDVQWTIQQYIDSAYLWYPAVGNHELPGAGQESYYGANMNWLRSYNAGGNTLPHVVNIGPTNCVETTFSFDYENVHFVMLNEYCNGTSDIGTDGDVLDSLYYWLADDLAANAKPLVFVFGHEPAYPQPDAYNGRERHVGDSLDKYKVRRDRFWALLQEYGVVAYICGHTHNYSAVRHRGVWQLDAAHARGAGDTGAPSTFFLVDVAGDSLSDVTVTVYRDIHDGAYDYDDLMHVIDPSEYLHAVDGLMDFNPQLELLDSLASDIEYGGDGQMDYLYFSWDDSTLYLAYEFNDFNSDGDLFVYFDSDTGGARTSTDWYVVHEFPPSFWADYAVCLEGGSWQDKRSWNAGSQEWEITSLGDTGCQAYAGWANYPLTEISVPFDEIAYHPADTLRFLVYCQQEEGGDLWISFPPGNPTGPCPLNGYYLYENLSPGAIPNEVDTVIVEDWVPPVMTSPSAMKAGNSVFLHWLGVVEDTAGCPEAVDHFVIYRSTQPNFTSGSEDSLDITMDTTYRDAFAAVGDTGIQHYYTVRAVDQGNNKSVPSLPVGEFDRDLANVK
jgi:hypothetical protein